MTSKFELFSRNKNNNLYRAKSMQTDWLQTLDEYWDERDTPQSYDYGFMA